MNTEPDPSIDRVIRALDDSVETLDAATLSKLNRARQLALAHATATPSRGQPGWLAGATLAAAGAITLGLWLAGNGPAPHVITPQQVDYLASAATLSDADLELVDELEFYAWLLETDDEG
jgi:hypothetical protein